MADHHGPPLTPVHRCSSQARQTFWHPTCQAQSPDQSPASTDRLTQQCHAMTPAAGLRLCGPCASIEARGTRLVKPGRWAA